VSTSSRAAPASSRRHAPARRRVLVARRRRRAALALAGAVAGGLVVVLVALPLARRAAHELGLPLRYSSIIRRQAAAERLDPALVAAVIYAETKFDARTSPAGAEGLMQIEPQTAEFLARLSGATSFRVSDLWKPSVNIAYGSYYLRYLLDRYSGSRWLALAAYNAGETQVDNWLAGARARHRRLTIASIPFPETRAYVEKVLQARKDYRQAHGAQLGLRSAA
jgi:peptidoglycan lytic transglycosylase